MFSPVELAVGLHLLHRYIWTVCIFSKYFCVLWSLEAIQKVGTQHPEGIQMADTQLQQVGLTVQNMS